MTSFGTWLLGKEKLSIFARENKMKNCPSVRVLNAILLNWANLHNIASSHARDNIVWM
jgi:hypothetical protein